MNPTADPVPNQTARHTAADVLTAGVRRLFETGQPDDAHRQHHGELLVADGNRSYSFCPVGAASLPVVAIDVAKIEWATDSHGEMAPANPLEPGELERLAEELERRGYPVRNTWNGHPGTTGSVGLRTPAHPGQVAAVERYRRGCQEHPGRSVFCDCEAWRAGFTRVVRPVVMPAKAPSPYRKLVDDVAAQMHDEDPAGYHGDGGPGECRRCATKAAGAEQ